MLFSIASPADDFVGGRHTLFVTVTHHTSCIALEEEDSEHERLEIEQKLNKAFLFVKG